MEPARLFPVVVLLGRAGDGAGVTIDARRFQPTVNN